MKYQIFIPSLNRAPQLKLLLESIKRNFDIDYDVTVVWNAHNQKFREGYEKLQHDGTEYINWVRETDFAIKLNKFLKRNNQEDQPVLFFTDDCIFYRKLSGRHLQDFWQESVWAISFRLGLNTIVQNYVNQQKQEALNVQGYSDFGDFISWDWKNRKLTDNYGYYFSWDGVAYRGADLWKLGENANLSCPRHFEGSIVNPENAAKIPRRIMVSPKYSTVICLAINAVQHEAVPNGQFHHYSPEYLNNQYLSGYSIDLDGFDFSNVISCHEEFRLQFKKEKATTHFLP